MTINFYILSTSFKYFNSNTYTHHQRFFWESKFPVIIQCFTSHYWQFRLLLHYMFLHSPYTGGSVKFGVQSLTQGHFNMLTAGSGIEPGAFKSLDNSSTIWSTAAPLSYRQCCHSSPLKVHMLVFFVSNKILTTKYKY